jgi:type I restriction enzyme S subunit
MGGPHLFQADLRKFRIPKPTLAIQQVIADSLDRETERIDVLVDAKRRLIDLLAEKRTALITHAVTKGLDPTVPMKDSGIPWIGSMPAHWSIRKLGHIGRVLGGTGFPDRYQGELAGDFPFYKVSDMTIKGNLSILSRAANYVSSDVVQDLGGTLIPRNAIVFPKVGAALLTNKRRLTDDLSLIDNNCMAVTFESGTPQYWVHLLGVLDFAWIVQPGPVPSISGSQVKDLLIPVPPTDEQQAISCSINAVAETALAASRILTSQLDLLAEYRQAVITAAVTGQLDEATLKRRKPVDEALGVEVPS